MNIKEQKLRDRIGEYVDVNRKSLEIAKSLTCSDCMEIKYLENLNNKIENIYKDICRIIQINTSDRTDSDKQFMDKYINIDVFVKEYKYKRDCILFINKIDKSIIGLEKGKQENIYKYGEDSYNFVVNLFNFTKKELDINGYNDKYSYAIYDLFTIIRDFYVDIIL